MKLLIILAVVHAASCNLAEDDDHHMGQPNLLELAKQLNLTTFAKGVEDTGLDRVLKSLGELSRVTVNKMCVNFKNRQTIFVTIVQNIVDYVYMQPSYFKAIIDVQKVQ